MFFIIIIAIRNLGIRSIPKASPTYYSTLYTGWLVTGGTSEKGMILGEKRSRKYRIKIFRLRLCFRENRL